MRDYESMKTLVTEELRRAFKPEFLNRVDETVIFHSLGREDLRRIVEIQVGLLLKRLEERKITLVLSDGAKDHLAEVGYDPTYGARPLKRAVQRLVFDPLSRGILGGQFREGDTVLAHLEKGVRGADVHPERGGVGAAGEGEGRREEESGRRPRGRGRGGRGLAAIRAEARQRASAARSPSRWRLRRQREEEDVPAAQQRSAAPVDEERQGGFERGVHRGERVLALDAREFTVVHKQVRDPARSRPASIPAMARASPTRAASGAGSRALPCTWSRRR